MPRRYMDERVYDMLSSVENKLMVLRNTEYIFIFVNDDVSVCVSL